MKKTLALLLSAVLLLSVLTPVAFAGIEYSGSYDTAIDLAKNDLTNLDNLKQAVTMLGQLGSYSFSKSYLLYFEQLIDLQSEKPDFTTIRLMLDLCGESEEFSAELESRGFPFCSDLLTYADAREQEYNGNLEEACAAFRKMSVLDSLDRARELTLALATAADAPEPFSPVFGLSDADFAAAARALTTAAAAWTAASAPKNLSELQLSADEVIRLYRGLREGTSAPERDGREYRLRCPVDDFLADSTPEAYVELYGADGAWADDFLTLVGTHTYTFSAPNDSRFDTVGEIRASWACDWADVGGTGWNETLTAALVFREGEETAAETVLELQNCAFDIAWVPGCTLGGAANEGSVSVYLRDWQTGKRLGLEFSMNTGRLIDAADDPAFSAWENASAQPKGHEWGEVKYDWSPDCGSCTARRICGICGYEDMETVSAAASVTRQPTCAVMGETTYIAQFTNSGFASQEKTFADIPLLAHEFGAPKYDWSADCRTCTATCVCLNCGEEQKESVSTGSSVTKQATCTSSGTTTHTAQFKNSAFTKQTKTVEIAMKGHSYGTPSYVWSGTDSVTASRTCTTCGHKESETVGTSSSVTKQATCTGKGTTTYTAQFKNSTFTKQTKTAEIPMKGHSWTPATYTSPERCTVCGLTRGSALLKVGSTIKFGHYEQDNNTANGREEIEWIVLDVQGDQALLISRYALDCRRYNDKSVSVTWESCDLRNWLNGTFLNTAFSAEEQARIPTVTVSADRNPEYSTSPGNGTQDQVFLLSIDESRAYFSNVGARKCTPTAYAKAQGCYVRQNYGTCLWWLRSPGYKSFLAAYVNYVGSVFAYGDFVYIDRYAVRPALWINLAS